MTTVQSQLPRDVVEEHAALHLPHLPHPLPGPCLVRRVLAPQEAPLPTRAHTDGSSGVSMVDHLVKGGMNLSETDLDLLTTGCPPATLIRVNHRRN
jgi:hypothetical protein